MNQPGDTPSEETVRALLNEILSGSTLIALLPTEGGHYNDVHIDVAYCRMDMFLTGMNQAADEFLRIYEAAWVGPWRTLDSGSLPLPKDLCSGPPQDGYMTHRRKSGSSNSSYFTGR